MGNTSIANCTDSAIAATPPYMPSSGSIDLATFSNNNTSYDLSTYNAATMIHHGDKLVEAVKYMKNRLRRGLPVLIGTHYISDKGRIPNNANRATRHFMVVVGMGMEGDNLYFRFYDPGTSKELSATSEDNKLVVNRQQGSIQGSYQDYTYTITEILKLN